MALQISAGGPAGEVGQGTIFLMPAVTHCCVVGAAGGAGVPVAAFSGNLNDKACLITLVSFRLAALQGWRGHAAQAANDFTSVTCDGKEGNSSFLQKRTKKLLFIGR